MTETPQAEEKPKELREPQRLEPDEITEIVTGLIKDQIFTANHCDNPRDMGMVFMPVGMGVLSDMDWDKIGNIVEWLDKAGPRSINGMPMFMSCKVIHLEDWKTIVERYEKTRAAMEEALKDA